MALYEWLAVPYYRYGDGDDDGDMDGQCIIISMVVCSI